jgi:hypothetical protein
METLKTTRKLCVYFNNLDRASEKAQNIYGALCRNEMLPDSFIYHRLPGYHYAEYIFVEGTSRTEVIPEESKLVDCVVGFGIEKICRLKIFDFVQSEREIGAAELKKMGRKRR